MELESADDVALADRMNAGRKAIIAELQKRIVGQGEVIEQVLLTLFARGHCLLVGVPGLAKTLLISTLAQVLDAEVQPHPVHARPDALRHHRHRRHPGRPAARDAASSRSPRARSSPTSCSPTKSTAPRRRRRPRCSRRCRSTRSRSAARTYTLDEPFFVLATQNPIEQEGTYPLPEAQLDRFMFHIVVEYPTRRRGVRRRPDDDGDRGPEVQPAGHRPPNSSRSSNSCGACRSPSR